MQRVVGQSSWWRGLLQQQIHLIDCCCRDHLYWILEWCSLIILKGMKYNYLVSWIEINLCQLFWYVKDHQIEHSLRKDYYEQCPIHVNRGVLYIILIFTINYLLEIASTLHFIKGSCLFNIFINFTTFNILIF